MNDINADVLRQLKEISDKLDADELGSIGSRNAKEVEDIFNAAMVTPNLSQRTDEQKAKDRARESSNTAAFVKILKTVGINMPSKVMDTSNKYKWAKEDSDDIKAKIHFENREATEDEQAKLDSLDETMEQTKTAYDLVSKFNPKLAGWVGIATLGISAMDGMNKAGMEAVKTFSDLQKSMSSLTYDWGNGYVEDTNAISAVNEARNKDLADRFNEIFAPVAQGFEQMESIWISIKEGLVTGLDWLINDRVDITDGKAESFYESDAYKEAVNAKQIKAINERTGVSMETLTSNYTSFAEHYRNMGESIGTSKGNADVLMYMALASAIRMAGGDVSKAAAYWDGAVEAVTGGAYDGKNNASYGVWADENMLTGWASERGTNIAATQYSDAMLDQMRLGMLMEQTDALTNGKTREEVDATAQSWAELGMEIKAASNALLGYDQANVLTSVDSTIPDFNQAQEILKGNIVTDQTVDKNEENIDKIKDQLREFIKYSSKFSDEEKKVLLDILNDGSFDSIINEMKDLGFSLEDILDGVLINYKYGTDEFCGYIDSMTKKVSSYIDSLLHLSDTLGFMDMPTYGLSARGKNSGAISTPRAGNGLPDFSSLELGTPTSTYRDILGGTSESGMTLDDVIAAAEKEYAVEQGDKDFLNGLSVLKGLAALNPMNWSALLGLKLGSEIGGAITGHASGGMTVSEHLALVGDNRGGKEVILPLDSPSTVGALRDALIQAGATGGGNQTDYHIHFDGMNFIDNDANVNRYAKKFANAVSNMERKGS